MLAHSVIRVAVATVGITGSLALADVDAAKKYVDEAKAELESRSFNDASSKLELAEAELEGVPAGDKAPVEAQIKAVKEQIAGAALAGDKQKYARKLTNAMDEAEGSIGNAVTWMGAERRVVEVLDDPAAKAAIPDELAAAAKKFATFKKINDRKAGAAMAAQTETEVKELETLWAEAKPKFAGDDASAKDSAATDVGRSLEGVRRTLARLPADDDATKAYATRVDKVGAEYAAIAMADEVKEKAATLKDSWESYKNDYAGWEEEKTGPTFAEYCAKQGGAMSALMAPKSVELIGRANAWLANRVDDESYKKLASAEPIKEIISKITADRDAALSKMEGFAEAIVKEAEGAKLEQRQIEMLTAFIDSLKNNIAGSSKLESLEARATALVDKFANAGAAQGEAAEAYYKTMTEKATAAWPEMKAKFECVEGFDPNAPADFKGKYILIDTDNLVGYRFSPGDFPFATTLNGVPVACKYDAAVASAVKEVESKIGRSLGDSDDDGKWQVIAVVDGTTGKLVKRSDVEGKIKDDAGNEATVTGERHETVDAPIVTIVAAHCGPLAVAKGQ